MEEKEGENIGPSNDRSYDPILRDIMPYISDPEYISMILDKAKVSKNAVEYIENVIKGAPEDKRADLNILLNRLTRKRKNGT